MSKTVQQSDQAVNEAALPVINTAARTEIKDILVKLDQNFDAPLRLKAAATPDSKLYISAGYVTQADGTSKAIPPVSSSIPTIVASTIDFQSGATTGATFDVVFPSTTVGQFRRLGLTLLSSGTIKGLFSAQAASVGALANAGTLFVSGGIPSGFIDLEATASTAFKTAGSATNVIENSVGGTARIFVFGSGGSGSGEADSGLGDDLVSLQFEASFRDDFNESPSTTLSAVDSTKTNAVYDVINTLYTLSYDADKTMTTTGTAATASGAPAFTVAAGDMVISGGYARRITSISSQTSYTLEAAFPIDLAAAACNISQSVHSKDIYGTTFDNIAIITAFGAQTFSEILVDYEDTTSSGDSVFDMGVAPVVGFSASSDNSSWSTVQVRPTSPRTQIPTLMLPTAGTALYIRLFANKSSGAGTVNVLGYKAYMQKSAVNSAGGVLNSAYAMLNGVGTPVNCTVGLSGGKSTITLNWQYPVGANPLTDHGSIDVYVDGQLIPRYVDATLTPDASYTEVNSNVIQLDKNYSSFAVSVKVLMRAAWVDQSSQNSTGITQLKEIQRFGHQPFVNNVSNMLSATSSTPSTGQFWSAVVNRAAITDISQDLRVLMGVDRIPVQTIYALQTEFGANGEIVSAEVNDDRNLIRFVGTWINNIDTSGQYASTVTTNDFIEVTFYGTGLNMMMVPAASMDFRITTNNGAEGSNLAVAYSTILNARGYSPNVVIPLISNLTLGTYTVKIRNNAASGIKTSGFQVLNESTTLKVNYGIAYANGTKLSLLTQQSSSYNSGFESGTLGSRGGRVLAYQKLDGTFAKAVTPVNPSQLNLASADHTNEEVARRHQPREFGSGRSDDFSLNNTTATRAFTLEDGVTTLETSSGSITPFIANVPEALSAASGTSNFFTLTVIGTGLDLLLSTNDANARSMTVSIDGNASIGTVTHSANAVTTNVKIVSGLPYGSHTFRFTNASASFATPPVVSFIVYQPKKPALPAGAIELADYNVMANYVANTTAGLDTVANGVLRKQLSQREPTLVNTWTLSSISPTSYIGAWNLGTAVATGYFEYTFYGTGFELRSATNTGWSANSTISLNGTTLTTANFGTMVSSVYGGYSFNSGTGVMSQAASTTAGSGLSISGLPLAKYTIRVTNNSGGLSMVVEAIDVITPIHSSRSNLSYDQQNTLPIGSQSISDNRKFTPTKDLGAKKKNISQAVGITSGPTTTSTSAIPMPDMSVVHFNTTGRIKITHFGRLDLATNAGTIVTNLDGSMVGPFASAFDNTGSNSSTVFYTYTLNVSPGFHKIDLHWYVSAGTLVATGTTRTLIVEEMD